MQAIFLTELQTWVMRERIAHHSKELVRLTVPNSGVVLTVPNLGYKLMRERNGRASDFDE